MRPRLLLCLLYCLPGLARADVLPPDLAAIYLKARENPKAYDRADQFCDGRSIGSPCEIPGNPFEGGGSGHCTQDINSASRSLDALCKLDDPPLIDRQTPEGGFQVSKELCDMASKNPDLASNLRSMDVRCDLPPATLTPDRFCQGRKPSFCFLTSLQKSSTKPIRPLPTAKTSVSAIGNRPCASSRRAAATNRTVTEIRIARMKQIPPMIGVPSLDLCQRGPISRIRTPAL